MPDPDTKSNGALAQFASADVTLPQRYAAACAALAAGEEIDECQSMADKAEALAIYAKQAKDDSLRQMADRIQARAVRRCGELLKEIQPPKIGRPPKENSAAADRVSKTRNQAATEAGLSERQRKTALNVADVPADQFEKAVESDRPPTVTKLAEQGRDAVRPPRPILNPRPAGAPPRTATATKPEPVAQPEPARVAEAMPEPQQAKEIAQLRRQIATLTKERDAAIRELDSAVEREQQAFRPTYPGGMPRWLPDIEARYRGRGAQIRRLERELAAARAAHGLGKDTEAEIGKLTTERDTAIRERDAARARIATLEAQLADDPGETAKLLRQNKILLGSARNHRRAAEANPAAIKQRDLRKLQRVFHPDTGRQATDQQRTEAAQIFNALELRVLDD